VNKNRVPRGREVLEVEAKPISTEKRLVRVGTELHFPAEKSPASSSRRTPARGRGQGRPLLAGNHHTGEDAAKIKGKDSIALKGQNCSVSCI